MFTARLQQHVTNQRRDNSRTNVKLNRTASNGDYELLTRVLWQVRFTDDCHERRNGHRSLRICDGAILIALIPPPGFLPAPALKSLPPASCPRFPACQSSEQHQPRASLSPTDASTIPHKLDHTLRLGFCSAPDSMFGSPNQRHRHGGRSAPQFGKGRRWSLVGRLEESRPKSRVRRGKVPLFMTRS